VQVADQQSAMFGQCCFNIGDVKCTLGTGTFIDCNTGQSPHASVAGHSNTSNTDVFGFVKPKFHYADFATKSGTSSRQSRGLVAATNHVSP